MAQPIPTEALNVVGTGASIMSIDSRMLKAVAPVYLFNVGPERHSVTRGGLGTKIIPPCEPGQRVSKPLEITGIYPEHRNLGEAVVCNYIHGIDLAQDILGIASTVPTNSEYTTNLEWKGVFLSMSPNPTDEQIEAAREKRKQHMLMFVADGDRRSLNGPGENGAGGIHRNHRNAVHELKLKRAWADPVVAQEECPACGSAIKAGIAVCPHCRAILNREAAVQFGLISPDQVRPEPETAPANSAEQTSQPRNTSANRNAK
jgi:hypothetical protein